MKTLILEELDMPLKTKNIDENTALDGEGLDLDSLGFVELIVLVEQHFDFQFSETEINLEAFKTIGSLSRLIANKLTPSENVA
ncbi:phosphopantetheine-binding protein [Limnofasciculus baicalensis]|nr:phosphopantetheine-binding protein [Limnofasciculus baicalensis]